MFIGLDGCKKGWILIAKVDGNSWQAEVISSIQHMLQMFPSPEQVLIDIPIGLPFKHPRLADGAARKVLTRLRGSSVFPVPSRQSLQAENYRAACDINLQLMDRKLSKQSWNIGDKILEVDSFVRSHDYPIRECHPEVAFWALNGKEPMPFGKKTKEGQQDRLNLLQSYWTASEEILEYCLSSYQRKVLLADDILDALALTISATYPLQCLPDDPELDEENLPMEIVYPIVRC